MKKILFAITAVSALCAAMPAAAQYRDRYPAQYGADTWFEARIDALKTRIDAGVRNRTIDRREAGNLRRELAGIDLWEDRLSMDGLNRTERDQLQRRLRLVRERIRVSDGVSELSDLFAPDLVDLRRRICPADEGGVEWHLRGAEG